jgi:hypothetical protein
MKGKGLDQKGFWDHERMKGIHAHTNVNTYTYIYIYIYRSYQRELESYCPNIILYVIGICKTLRGLGDVIII